MLAEVPIERRCKLQAGRTTCRWRALTQSAKMPLFSAAVMTRAVGQKHDYKCEYLGGSINRCTNKANYDELFMRAVLIDNMRALSCKTRCLMLVDLQKTRQKHSTTEKRRNLCKQPKLRPNLRYVTSGHFASARSIGFQAVARANETFFALACKLKKANCTRRNAHSCFIILTDLIVCLRTNALDLNRRRTLNAASAKLSEQT